MKEENQQNITHKIDVREIFHQKNPKLAPYLPGFIYSYLKKILHQDYINYFLEKHGSKKDIAFAKASVKEFNISTEIVGLENIPKNGNLIFASNHPLGGFDGMLLISILGDFFPDIKSLANDILMNIKNMGGVFIPINKHGKQSTDAVRIIDKVFEGDQPVLTFPAGLVSRKKKGVIKDLEWKKNFITKSIKHKRDIIPVHVSGHCSNFFYNLSNFRKFLGIKSNIEMFYLPDETYSHRNEHIKVTFGKTIPYGKLSKEKKPAEWASLICDLVYLIDNEPNATLDSFY